MTEMNPVGNIANLEKQYQGLKTLYESMVDEVLFVLNRDVSQKGIRVHSITSRPEKIKSFKSVCDKLQRKNLKNCNEIEDIAGVRVICLYRSDLQKIGDIISGCFLVVDADTSRTRTEAAFGYASDHYVVKLSSDYRGARYDSIKDIKCEIQVRTILMDAWASVSHHLIYKQEVDIPRDLRVDFNSLAGLFYVADTHFQFFRDGVEETRAILLKSIQHDTFDVNQETNFETLSAYVKWKFPERKRLLTSSDIVLELRKYGYAHIKQLDDKVNIMLPFLKQHEIEAFNSLSRKPKSRAWTEQWAIEGMIRHILDMMDDNYFKDRQDLPSDVIKLNTKQRKQVRSMT